MIVFNNTTCDNRLLRNVVVLVVGALAAAVAGPPFATPFFTKLRSDLASTE
jgi:hypothetical protein